MHSLVVVVVVVVVFIFVVAGVLGGYKQEYVPVMGTSPLQFFPPSHCKQLVVGWLLCCGVESKDVGYSSLILYYYSVLLVLPSLKDNIHRVLGWEKI